MSGGKPAFILRESFTPRVASGFVRVVGVVGVTTGVNRSVVDEGGTEVPGQVPSPFRYNLSTMTTRSTWLNIGINTWELEDVKRLLGWYVENRSEYKFRLKCATVVRMMQLHSYSDS